MQLLRSRLEQAHPIGLAAFAIFAAFTAYFSMYAFRKPFAAGFFDEEVYGVHLKIALVLSQLVGYSLSKFIGIRLVSELPRPWRSRTLLGLIAIAELALIAFAWLPPTGKIVAIFFNGLPLGAVWGLVFSFLEGRRNSEILGAGLSTSYIVASGAVKSVGAWILQSGFSESAMPALTGALFWIPFIFAVWLLHCLPPPSQADEAARTTRNTMNRQERKSFFWKYAPGLISLTVLYVLLTGYRDMRDNFSAEIFREVGIDHSSVFATSETWIAIIVLASLAAIYRISDNHRAFFVIHLLMIFGSAGIGIATLLFQWEIIGGLAWMIGVGSGLYLAYVPYGCVLFDRLIATQRSIATAVFMIYVTDAFGYVGSIGVLLYKDFGQSAVSWLDFFVQFSYLTSAVAIVGFISSWLYFSHQHFQPNKNSAPSE